MRSYIRKIKNLRRNTICQYDSNATSLEALDDQTILYIFSFLDPYSLFIIVPLLNHRLKRNSEDPNLIHGLNHQTRIFFHSLYQHLLIPNNTFFKRRRDKNKAITARIDKLKNTINSLMVMDFGKLSIFIYELLFRNIAEEIDSVLLNHEKPRKDEDSGSTDGYTTTKVNVVIDEVNHLRTDVKNALITMIESTLELSSLLDNNDLSLKINLLLCLLCELKSLEMTGKNKRYQLYIRSLEMYRDNIISTIKESEFAKYTEALNYAQDVLATHSASDAVSDACSFMIQRIERCQKELTASIDVLDVDQHCFNHLHRACSVVIKQQAAALNKSSRLDDCLNEIVATINNLVTSRLQEPFNTYSAKL